MAAFQPRGFYMVVWMGALFPGTSLLPQTSALVPYGDPSGGVLSVGLGGVLLGELEPPKHYQLEFPTYDGSIDPLN